MYKKQYIDKKISKIKRAIGLKKSKGFLIILLSYNENEHKYLKLNGKREDRESVDKFICIRGIYSVCTIIPCFDCIALCIIYNPKILYLSFK